MSRAKRTGRLLLVVMFLATGLLAPGMIQPPEAVAKNGVHVNQATKTITITVNVTVIGANNATLATSWTEAFNAHWGKSEGYRYACWTVILKADIQPGSSMQEGQHTVFVVDTRQGQKWRDGVRWPRNHRPDQDSAKAYWSDPSSHEGAVPHEFGHVLDLRDEYQDFVDGEGKTFSVPNPNLAPEYQWNDTKPKNGKVDRGEVTLKPGETPSLMADHTVGQVLPRHIENLVKNHVDPDELTCEWTGNVDTTTVGAISDPELTGTHTTIYDMTLAFEEDADGIISGTADALITHDGGGTFADGCSWSQTIDPITTLLEVSGERTAEEMILTLRSDGPIEGDVTYADCHQSFTVPYDWGLDVNHVFDSERLVRDGDAYVLDWSDTISTPGGGSGEWRMVIRVEPADDEGVPVG